MAVSVSTTRKKSKASRVQPRKPARTAALRSRTGVVGVVTGRKMVRARSGRQRGRAPRRIIGTVKPLALFLTVIVVPAALLAQDNYEIQVYGADLVDPHATMFELHSNFTFDGRSTVVDGLYPTQHALHETLEITHGFSPWFEVGFYAFTSVRAGQGWDWVGDHIRPRFRIPESWHWPVGVSLSQEIGYQRRVFSPDTWTWEIRPIIDQRAGRLYWAVDPTLEKSLRGESAGKGFEFSPNVSVTYDVTSKVTLGLEYY